MLTIGFTEKYYTLWSVGEPYEEKHYYNGLCVGSTWKQECHYIQNLSMDLDRAKAKAQSMGEYEINLELKGQSSFTYTVSSNIKNREDYFPHDCFSFGQYEGTKIMDCDNVWQIERAYKNEKSARRRAYARRKLIDLGLLVRYTWYEEVCIGDANWGKRDENGNCLPEDIKYEKVKRNYATPEYVNVMEGVKYFDSLEKGYLFEDGQKVEIEIKRIASKSFSFNGSFGKTYVENYVTRCGKLVKYMGSSPVDISEKEFVKVQATIKHDFYTEAETKLIRIKDVTDYSHLFLPNTDESAIKFYEMAMDDKNVPSDFIELFKSNYKKFKFKKSDYEKAGELSHSGLIRICNLLGI